MHRPPESLSSGNTTNWIPRHHHARTCASGSFFRPVLFFRLSGERRRRARERGEREPPREKYIELIQFRPYAVVPPSRVLRSFFRSAFTFALRRFLSVGPFSPPSPPSPPPPFPLPSTRLEFIFPYESSVLNSQRHAGFKYG